MKEKMQSAIKLLKSKAYVLITENETVMHAPLEGLKGLMQLQVLQHLHERLTSVIKATEKKISKK